MAAQRALLLALALAAAVAAPALGAAQVRSAPTRHPHALFWAHDRGGVRQLGHRAAPTSLPPHPYLRRERR